MATSYPGALDDFTNPTSGDTLDSPSHSAQHANANDAVEAIELKLGTGASASTAATSGQVLMASTGGATSWSDITTLSNLNLTSPEETLTISATAASGTVDLNLATTGATYYTSDASANWAVNLRADGTTSLDSLLSTNQSITHAFLVTQGGTAYYPNEFYVDGGTVVPKWQGGAAPTAGNVSSVDSYTFVAVKTAGTTFTVLASQTQFA